MLARIDAYESGRLPTASRSSGPAGERATRSATDGWARLHSTSKTKRSCSTGHRRVRGPKLELGFPGSRFRPCYGLASTPKLLPGLRLDTLTVLDDADYQHGYETLDELVREGSGLGRPPLPQPKLRVARRGCCGSVLDEENHEIYEQEVPRDKLSTEDFGIWGGKPPLVDGGHKEMTIVAEEAPISTIRRRRALRSPGAIFARTWRGGCGVLSDTTALTP
ncbi:hypothetical protein DL769_008150 [Monosporascus sp. CRB-8-3]|nr:hypothetical protein DL769_008150 [Monosporascus sp. CRB-8-3]